MLPAQLLLLSQTNRSGGAHQRAQLAVAVWDKEFALRALLLPHLTKGRLLLLGHILTAVRLVRGHQREALQSRFVTVLSSGFAIRERDKRLRSVVPLQLHHLKSRDTRMMPKGSVHVRRGACKS